MPLPNLFETGKILGKARLTTTIHFTDANMFFNYRNRHLNSPSWWNRKLHGFVFRDIEQITPKPCKGQLGIFNIPL